MIGFHYPYSFLFLVPFSALIILFIWSRWKRRVDLQRLGDGRLLPFLIPLPALVRRRRKDMLAMAGLLCVIFATAGPQFGSQLKEVKHRGVDVFIAMDTSRSMLADDVQPSRLERAKRSLGLLIDKLAGNRTGVIAFAKYAVIQCPLTVDTEAARMFLDILDENTVPLQGTAIGDAIRLGIKSFSKDDKTGKVIVLLTDGEDHRSDPVGAAKLAKENGIVLFTIGIGTTKGEVIKKRDEQGNVVEYHKYKGEMVMTQLDDALLTKIAQITGGHYYRASSTDKEIDEIAEIVNSYNKREFSSKIYERLKERYQFFLLLGFLLLLIEFFYGETPGQRARISSRAQAITAEWLPKLKRSATGLLLIFALAVPSWADLKKHVRKGNALLKKGDIAGARSEFEAARIDAPEEAFLPYNIAATYYMEGNFPEAKKLYEQAFEMAQNPDLKSKVAYNLGHLLFSMGQKGESIEQFKKCLRLNPKDMDAKYNIEYIKSGKEPKAGGQPQQNDLKGASQEEENKDKAESKPTEQEEGDKKEETKTIKPGDISKEEAEQVLQMMREQEKDQLKNAQRMPRPVDKQQKEASSEDW